MVGHAGDSSQRPRHVAFALLVRVDLDVATDRASGLARPWRGRYRTRHMPKEEAMIRMDRRQFLTLAAGSGALAWTPPIAYAQGRINPGETDALGVIDVQNCFVPGGTPPVPEGDNIIPIINRLAPPFR